MENVSDQAALAQQKVAREKGTQNHLYQESSMNN